MTAFHRLTIDSEDRAEPSTSCFSLWNFCRTNWYEEGSPARVNALRELRECFHSIQKDVIVQDSKCRRMYTRFFAHTASGADPELEYFIGALAWYKKNRDEMHETMEELLVLFGNAQCNGEMCAVEWEPMPEKIRARRRRWRQSYTHEYRAERNVCESFSMPKVPRDAAIDAETDAEYMSHCE